MTCLDSCSEVSQGKFSCTAHFIWQTQAAGQDHTLPVEPWTGMFLCPDGGRAEVIFSFANPSGRNDVLSRAL